MFLSFYFSVCFRLILYFSCEFLRLLFFSLNCVCVYLRVRFDSIVSLSLSLTPVTVISFTLVLRVLFELSNDRTMSLLKTKTYSAYNFVCESSKTFSSNYIFSFDFLLPFISAIFHPWLTWKFHISLSIFPLSLSL